MDSQLLSNKTNQTSQQVAQEPNKATSELEQPVTEPEPESSSAFIANSTSSVPKPLMDRLSNLPLEVLTEIASHLSPVSLICLSLTAKGFWKIPRIARLPRPSAGLRLKNEDEVPLYSLLNTWMENQGLTLIVVQQLRRLLRVGGVNWIPSPTSYVAFVPAAVIKDEAIARLYAEHYATRYFYSDQSLRQDYDIEYVVWQVGLGNPQPRRNDNWATIDKYYELRRNLLKYNGQLGGY